MRRRPSIFSSTYREQVRRQRINIILIILIVIAAAYFGGKYYINKNDIKLFKDSRVANFIQSIKEKAATQKGIGKEKENPPANEGVGNSEPKTDPQPTTQAPEAPEKKEGQYDYSLSDGKVVSVEYTILGDRREIKGLKDAGTGIAYDISGDKQKIVFEDKVTQDIIIGDINGSFGKLTLGEYVSKTSGEVVKKDYNQQRRPWYIWSQKPHFTTDGRVVYLSHLPYLQPDSGLHLWSVEIDGTGHRKIGKLSNNIAEISYVGYAEDGSLKVKSGEIVYYLKQGSNTLKK